MPSSSVKKKKKSCCLIDGRGWHSFFEKELVAVNDQIYVY